MNSVLAAGLIVLCGNAAFADSSNSGNIRLPGCHNAAAGSPVAGEADAMGRGICLGEITALIAMSGFLQRPYAFCVPSGGTAGQATRIVLKAIEGAPERTHIDFVVLAIDALARAWPCQK